MRQLFADQIMQLSAGYVRPSSPTTVVLWSLVSTDRSAATGNCVGK